MAKDNQSNQLKKIIKSINKAAKDDSPIKIEKLTKNDEYEKLIDALNKLILGYNEKLQDQSRIKKVDKQLNRLNRALRVLSECNQKIIRAETEESILKKIPEVLVNIGSYPFVWIGYKINDKNKSIKPVSFAGSTNNFLDKLNISWADNKSGRGPTGTAVRTGKYVICQNIETDPLYSSWWEIGDKEGYLASISLPLKEEKNVFGVLNIYASGASAFDEDEIKLLNELAGDISFGIAALRTKEKHELAKKSLEQSTAQSRFLANILELSSQPFSLSYPDGTLRIFNKAFCNLLGYKEEELKALNWKDFTPKEWKEFEENKLTELKCNGEPIRYEKEYFHKNGSRIPVELLVHKSCNDKNELQYFYAFITDVTNRKKIEEALRYTQFSVDKTRDAIYWLQEDGKFVYVNEAACKSLVYTKEELLSLDIFDIDPNFTKSIWKDHWKKTRELESYLVETNHKTKEGKIFPVEVAINFMSFAGKEYHSAYARDISERKKAEEQLQSTQFGIDNSQIGIFQIDESGQIIYANKYACKSLGYTSLEILNLKIWELDPFLSEEHWIEYRENASKSNTISKETIHRRKDGTEFPVEVHINFIEFENKKLSFSFVKDITERKLFEKEQKQSEEKFRNIFNNSPVGIYRTTPEGKILDVNQTILSMLKYNSFSELFEKDLEKDEFYTKNSPRKAFKDLLENEGEIKNFETIWIRKDQTEIYVRENARAIKDQNGNILYYEGTVEDITEFKEAQKKLRESERLFNTLAESGHYIIYLINKQLKFTYVNKYASQYFSSNPEQMINQPVKNFYMANSDQIALANINIVFHELEINIL